MLRLILTVITLAISLGGCTQAPRDELQAARMSVARAYAAGAENLAAAEYQAASEALSEGERFARQGNYKMAREVLPFAEALGHRAILKAKEEQMIRELQHIRDQQQNETDSTQESMKPPTQSTKNAISAHTPVPRPKPTAPASPPVSPPLRHYTASVEESLWSISARKEVYGDPLLWPLIYRANRDQVKDPRRIYPGQILSIPRNVTNADLEDARNRARQSDFFTTEQILPSSR